MKAALCLVLVLLLPVSCVVSDVGIGLRAGSMQVDPSGHLALQNSAKTNQPDDVRIDLADGFDVADEKTPILGARYEHDNFEFDVSAFYHDASQRSTLTQSFGDIAASVASPTPVTSDLTFINAKATAAYKLLDLPMLDLSAGIAFDFFSVDMDVRSATAFENMSFTAPAPMLFGRAKADIWLLSGLLELAWLDLDLEDAKGSFFDLNAMISYRPLPEFELFIGYRNILIDVQGDFDGQDFATHLRISGLYLGGGVTF